MLTLRTATLRSKYSATAGRIYHRFKSAATAETSVESDASTSVPIVPSLLAAAAGIATVAAVATFVESTAPTPTFDPKEQRFDQSTFVGRFSRMILACDPRLLFYTKEQVSAMQDMLMHYKDYKGSDRDLWEARRIVEAAVNPDTPDQTIPRPFRMSGYVPFNGLICVATVSSPSTSLLLFWSWVNQSQNALVNYYNRNASSPMSNETLVKSYTAAVVSALAVAFGLATFIQKRYEPSKARQLLRFVAFPSAVVSSSLNCYFVRSPELETGISLMNEKGDDVLPGETSQVAAARGVYSTTASRAILQAPVYFLPPFLMQALPFFRNYIARNPAMTVPLTTYLLLVSFGVGLPATVAIFPQISSISANDVEEKFAHIRTPETNKAYEVFYYNKGL